MLTYVIEGLRAFAIKRGRIRLIASPELTEDDLAAIASGYAERKQLTLRRVAEALDGFLHSANKDVKGLLRELIKSSLLDVKLAVSEVGGIFHEKIGIFGDGRDYVAFTGSLNETAAAFAANFESIDVFTSWSEPIRVAQKRRDFESLWTNNTARVEIIDFPDYLKHRIVVADSINSTFGRLPANFKLRPYQMEAVEAWMKAGRVGFLSMATGSGKTVTALEAIRRTFSSALQTAVILVPLKHLAEQWASNVSEFLDLTPIVCHSDNDWRTLVQLARASQAISSTTPPVLLIATYATAQTAEFAGAVVRLPGERLIVADEAHNITPDNVEQVLLPAYSFRIGLSATPNRYLDEVGTRRVLDYFGGVIFEYTLRDAIVNGYLTPYYYRPVLCTLTNTEQVEYDQLMRSVEHSAQTAAHNLLLFNKRTSLLERAWDKMSKFETTFSSTSVATDGHALVYCHPDLIDVVMGFVGHTLKVRAHRFTAHETLEERGSILGRFVKGDLKVLVAIRCLDEGVDVPSVRTAFLLNSTSNPKEFIQRRGRVLRRAPGKAHATIYDFVVLPRRSTAIDQALLQKELGRFSDFASLAINGNEARIELESFASKINISI